jgi:hypothetical protein
MSLIDQKGGSYNMWRKEIQKIRSQGMIAGRKYNLMTMTSTCHLDLVSSSISHGMPPKTTIRRNKHFKKEDLPASSIAVTKLCSLARPHCVPGMLMVSPSRIYLMSRQQQKKKI